MTTKHKQSSKTAVQTQTTKTTQLTPTEEKVVRMRHGLRAPDSMKLEMVGQNNPDTAAELADIERRALAAVGARQNNTKRKIIASLRRSR